MRWRIAFPSRSRARPHLEAHACSRSIRYKDFPSPHISACFDKPVSEKTMAHRPPGPRCPKETEGPDADPAQAQAEPAAVAAFELPEPESISGWDKLPRLPQNTEPRYKGILTALVMAIEQIPPCIYVVNLHTEPIRWWYPSTVQGIEASSNGPSTSHSVFRFGYSRLPTGGSVMLKEMMDEGCGLSLPVFMANLIVALTAATFGFPLLLWSVKV
ncbi:uncharacterized protein B0T15DRAFT_217375 [Chaetomium strumarium]|uniref:Uncharacterized protein n=1 Tax=Chaetomium strumarium TaxID=1170767 RepID=A0AAJ0GTW2_9PEZI|nr:hypothetical protein B0T15DRAFT_217375 [Chaetomium strumarium]